MLIIHFYFIFGSLTSFFSILFLYADVIQVEACSIPFLYNLSLSFWQIIANKKFYTHCLSVHVMYVVSIWSVKWSPFQLFEFIKAARLWNGETPHPTWTTLKYPASYHPITKLKSFLSNNNTIDMHIDIFWLTSIYGVFFFLSSWTMDLLSHVGFQP